MITVSSLRCCIAVAFATVLCSTATANAQALAVWGPDLARVSDATAAPTAMQTVCPVSNRDDGGVELYAITSNGFEMKSFDATFWNWHGWNWFGNQSHVPVTGLPVQGVPPWDPMLTGLSWSESSATSPIPRFNLFHAFSYIGANNDVRLGLGEPWGRQPAEAPGYYHYTIDAAPGGEFFPKSTFGQSGGQINVFGTDKPAHHPYLPASREDRSNFGEPATRMVERYWSGSAWAYTQHYMSGYEALLLGPSGSAWVGSGTIPGAVGVVGTRLGAPVLLAREWRPTYGAWDVVELSTSLSPRASAYRAPLLVAYQKGGNWYIRYFVVGYVNSGPTSEWRLFSKEMHPDGFWYDDAGRPGPESWNDHGTAPNIKRYRYAGDKGDVNGKPFGFDMTARVTWNSGGRMRVNIFGHSDLGDQLTEFFFDGYTWQWGTTSHPNPYGSTGAWPMYCDGAVLSNRGGNYQRVSVFAHLSNGEIWERRYDFHLGGGWVWQPISLIGLAPPPQQPPPPSREHRECGKQCVNSWIECLHERGPERPTPIQCADLLEDCRARCPADEPRPAPPRL